MEHEIMRMDIEFNQTGCVHSAALCSIHALWNERESLVKIFGEWWNTEICSVCVIHKSRNSATSAVFFIFVLVHITILSNKDHCRRFRVEIALPEIFYPYLHNVAYKMLRYTHTHILNSSSFSKCFSITFGFAPFEIA